MSIMKMKMNFNFNYTLSVGGMERPGQRKTADLYAPHNDL